MPEYTREKNDAEFGEPRFELETFETTQLLVNGQVAGEVSSIPQISSFEDATDQLNPHVYDQLIEDGIQNIENQRLDQRHTGQNSLFGGFGLGVSLGVLGVVLMNVNEGMAEEVIGAGLLAGAFASAGVGYKMYKDRTSPDAPEVQKLETMLDRLKSKKRSKFPE